MQTVKPNSAITGTCTISGAPAPVASFTLTSTTTAMGNRSHVVTTTDRDFAFALFEQALDIDIEPDFAYQKKGVYCIEFICLDCDAAATIAAAQVFAACGLVGAA